MDIGSYGPYSKNGRMEKMHAMPDISAISAYVKNGYNALIKKPFPVPLEILEEIFLRGRKIEEVMVPHPNERVQTNFVTSHQICKKSQLIDLAVEGYNPFMDHFQPDVKISDCTKYAPLRDCGSQYEIQVELLNQNKRPIKTFAPEAVYFEQWNDQSWNQMTHVFRNYGPGVRYIRFTHGGKRTRCWAGWYGIRVTDSCAEICPSVET